jgi:hypothetical protein
LLPESIDDVKGWQMKKFEDRCSVHLISPKYSAKQWFEAENSSTWGRLIISTVKLLLFSLELFNINAKG